MAGKVTSLNQFKRAREKGFSTSEASELASGAGSREVFAAKIAGMGDGEVIYDLNHNIDMFEYDRDQALDFIIYLQEIIRAPHFDVNTIIQTMSCLLVSSMDISSFPHSDLISHDVLLETMHIAIQNPSCQNHAFWAFLTRSIAQLEGKVSRGGDVLEAASLELLKNGEMIGKYPFWQQWTEKLLQEGSISITARVKNQMGYQAWQPPEHN